MRSLQQLIYFFFLFRFSFAQIDLDLNDLIMGQQGKAGADKAGAFACGADEIAVQVLNAEPESNGCSKPAGIAVEGEEDFTYCCDRHDACYSSCNVLKRHCDTDFDKCMRKMCNVTFPHNPQCLRAAGLYSMATEMFGTSGYRGSQHKYCTCISAAPSKEDASAAHYTKLLKSFYAKYPTDEAVRNRAVTKYVSDVVVSEKWSGRLHMLYYTLLKKYDNAIAHIDGRKGKKNIPTPEQGKKNSKTMHPVEKNVEKSKKAEL